MASTKKSKPQFYNGLVVRFKKYKDDMPEGNLKEGDLIHLTDVPENYLHYAMIGEVIEREDGKLPPTTITEEVFFDECEVYGEYADYVASRGDSEVSEVQSSDSSQGELIKHTSTKNKSTKVVKAKQEVAVQQAAQTTDGTPPTADVVPASTNTLMTYLNRVDIHEAAVEVSKIADSSTAVLAALLHEMYQSGKYRDYIDMSKSDAKDNFETYLEQNFSETLKYRKGMYLVSSYAFLQRMGLDANTICDIGYAKIQSLMELENNRKLLEQDPDIIKRMAERAKEVSKGKFQEEVRQLAEVESSIADTMSSPESLHTIKFHLFQEDYRRFNEVMTKYMADNMETDMAKAIVSLLDSYDIMTSGDTPSLEYDLQNFEARHGVKVQVISDDKK